MSVMNEEIQSKLLNEFQYNPDGLQKRMSMENMVFLCQLGLETNHEIIQQIIGSLVSTYINQNHSQIQDYQSLQQFSWTMLHKSQSQNKAVYHFLSSILANVLFHFYDKIPSDQFSKELIVLMNSNPIAGFTALETIIRRMKPPHKLHKEAIITLDSKHRMIKNQFYRHNLELLLQMIANIFQTPITFLIGPAVEFFRLLLDIEFVTDTKEKDWHKMKRAEIKNNRSLESQLREFKQPILEQEIIANMILNSHIEWLDPTRSDIKKLWGNIRNQEFIQILINLLPNYSGLWGVLGKICKIFTKHFKNDRISIELVQFMVLQLKQVNLDQNNLVLYLKLASRTLHAVQDEEWIQFNLKIVQQIVSQDQLAFGFKFIRNLCRVSRQYDYGQLHNVIMPLIMEFYQKFVTNQLWNKHSPLYKNIRYNVKVISVLMIEQYLQYFHMAMQNNMAVVELQKVLDYFSLGLFSSIRATSYQIDVLNKMKFYRKEQFIYPIDEIAFGRLEYKKVYANALSIAFHCAIEIEKQTNEPSRFHYQFWKSVLNTESTIRFEEIIELMTVDRVLLFDFSRVFKYQNKELILKILQVIYDTKIRWVEDHVITMNLIVLPQSVLSTFSKFELINDLEISKLFYAIQTTIFNAQNEHITNQEESYTLVSNFTSQLFNVIQQVIKQPTQLIPFCSSILDIKGRCTYVQIMTLFWEKQMFEQFEQYITHVSIMLRFTRQMIHPDSITNLRSEVIDSLLEWINKLSKYVVNLLQTQYDSLTQERQLGQRIEKQIYQLYYKPILQLLKLFKNVQFLNRCSTSKVYLKAEIYKHIFATLHLIIKDDVSCYIHKMEPLYQVCQWLIQFEGPRKQMPDSTMHLILEFYNAAINLQERKAFSITTKSFYDLLNLPDLVRKHIIPIQFIIDSCVVAAFNHNLRVKEIGNIVLRFLKLYPECFDNLIMSIKQRNIVNKSQNWSLMYDIQANKVKTSIPKSVTPSNEKAFADIFLQFQMFYNYYT